MNLYEIAAEYREKLEEINALDLPPDAVLDTVESMQGDLESKLRAVVAYGRELQALADARAAEAKRMKDGADTMAQRADAMLTYAQIAIMNTGIKLPLVFSEFTLNLAKNPQGVTVADVAALPKEFVRVIPAREEADKVAIGKALKAGETVPGASLGPITYRLTVR